MQKKYGGAGGEDGDNLNCEDRERLLRRLREPLRCKVHQHHRLQQEPYLEEMCACPLIYRLVGGQAGYREGDEN